MSYSALIALLAAAINAALTVLVVTQNLKPQLKAVFTGWGIALFTWNFGTFMLFQLSPAQEPLAMWWAQFLQTGVIFLPVLFFHLALLISQVTLARGVIPGIYACYVIVAILNFGGFYIPEIRYVDPISAWYSRGGALFWTWTFLYSLTCSLAFYILLVRRKALPAIHRHRINALILVELILVGGGTIDLLPILGVYYWPLSHASIFPVGNACAIIYGILVAYSVLQHQLLDLNLVLGHFAARIIRILFFWITTFALLLIIGLVAPENAFPPFAFLASMGVIVLTTLMATVFFPKLFGKDTGNIERLLLGDHFEYHDKVREVIDSVQHHTEIPVMMDELHNLFTDVIRVSSYQILLLDDRSKEFVPNRCYPESSAALLPVISQDSNITHIFERRGISHFGFNIRYSDPGADGLERKVRDDFAALDPELCFCLRVGSEPIGFFYLGDKTNNEPYTSVDIELITSLVANLSLFLNQDRLKQQLLVTQEHDLLGRMSRGIAHDLNNLLTPVLTFLQLTEEGLTGPDMKDELLPTALRNVQTARQYVRESLFFSEHNKPNLSATNISTLLQEVTDMNHEQWSDKSISVLLKAPDDLVAEVDPLLFKRVLTNLLSNAIDASEQNGVIELSASLSSSSEKHNNWLCLIVKDYGEGISEDHIRKLGQPYFTTKDTGSGKRGFGLGLAICRRILQLHGGTWKISSELGQGTEFRLEIPTEAAKTEELLEA